MGKRKAGAIAVTVAIFVAAVAVSIGQGERNGNGLEEFIGSMIVFPEDIGKDTDEAVLVVYYDSASCATCQIKRIWEWRELIGDIIGNGKVRPVFVFSPRESDRGTYETEREKSGLEFRIISDYGHRFAELNPSIPSNNRLHTFLTDRDGKVVFAGDPMHSSLMLEIYRKYITALSGNGGLLPENYAAEIEEFITARQHPESGLYFESADMDIGAVRTDAVTAVSFTAMNVSADTIVIERVLADCDCVTTEVSADSIPPAGRCVIEVGFTPEKSGSFEKFIFLKLLGQAEEITLTIRGINI